MHIVENIREELKAIGIKPRQVSIRRDGSSANVTIKDLSVEYDKVNEAAHKFEKIDRCEYSGEILCGGNRFVFVDYDWRVESAAKETELYKELLAKAEAALAKIGENDSHGEEIVPGYVIFKVDWRLQASVKWSQNCWEHPGSVSSIALELYKAKLQGKF